MKSRLLGRDFLHYSANKTTHYRTYVTGNEPYGEGVSESLDFGSRKVHRSYVKYSFACPHYYRRAAGNVTVYSVRLVYSLQQRERTVARQRSDYQKFAQLVGYAEKSKHGRHYLGEITVESAQ